MLMLKMELRRSVDPSPVQNLQSIIRHIATHILIPAYSQQKAEYESPLYYVHDSDVQLLGLRHRLGFLSIDAALSCRTLYTCKDAVREEHAGYVLQTRSLGMQVLIFCWVLGRWLI